MTFFCQHEEGFISFFSDNNSLKSDSRHEVIDEIFINALISKYLFYFLVYCIISSKIIVFEVRICVNFMTFCNRKQNNYLFW